MPANNYERVTAAILAALQNDLPAWRRPWRTFRAQGAATMPRNAITGRSYRGLNVPLLLIGPWSDQRYLTYRQAEAAGGHVRRGEHGQQVTFWQRTERKGTDDNGQPTVRRSLLLKVYTVFNVAQCDGLDLPAGDANAPTDSHATVLEIAGRVGAKIQHGGDRACYLPTWDMVQLPPLAAFTDADAYAATAFHELGHWTGNKARLDRDLSGRFGTRAYAAEELVAELTAAYMCAEYGINSALEHHASYIANWRALLADDPRAVVTAASKAQAAADYLIGEGAEAADVDDDAAPVTATEEAAAA